MSCRRESGASSTQNLIESGPLQPTRETCTEDDWAVYVVDVGTLKMTSSGTLKKASTSAWAEVLGSGSLVQSADTGRPPNPAFGPAKNLASRIWKQHSDGRLIVLAAEAPMWFPYWKLGCPPPGGDCERARFLEEETENARWYAGYGPQAALRAVGYLQLIFGSAPAHATFQLLQDPTQLQIASRDSALPPVLLCEAFVTGRYKAPYRGNWTYAGHQPTGEDEEDALWAASAVVERVFKAIATKQSHAMIMKSSLTLATTRRMTVEPPQPQVTVAQRTTVTLEKAVVSAALAPRKGLRKGTIADLAPGTNLALGIPGSRDIVVPPQTRVELLPWASSGFQACIILPVAATIPVAAGANIQLGAGGVHSLLRNLEVSLHSSTASNPVSLAMAAWDGHASILWPSSAPKFSNNAAEAKFSVWKWVVEASGHQLSQPSGQPPFECAVFGRFW